MTGAAISIESLRKSFGARAVLKDLCLSVAEGSTFAFLGRNGQGKTTTIRALLGLLPTDGGQISVLGLDPCRQAIEVRSRVGYLAEDQRMYGWMTVKETIEFTRSFYDEWDETLVTRLLADFELRAADKVGALSKGQNVRLGLLLALAHRPRLMILDDPTLGLDPIMRRQFMRNVIDLLQGNGTTVFFSSHLLYEIEPVADEVAILEGGGILRQASTEELRGDVRQFNLAAETFQKMRAEGVLNAESAGRQVGVVAEKADEFRAALQRDGVEFREVELNLDEIFEAYVIGNRGRCSNA